MSHDSARPSHLASVGNAAGRPAALGAGAGERSGLKAELLPALLDAMPDAVLIVSDDELIVEANAAACAVLALPRDQVVGARVAELLQPGLDYSAARNALLRDGRLHGPTRLPFANGQVRDMIVEARARVAADLHMLVLHDVTERDRYQHALRSAEHRFHAVFDGIGDAILVICAENAVRDANAAAVALLGCSRADLLERRIEDLFADPSDLLKARATIPGHRRAQGKAAVWRNGAPIAVDYTLSAQGDQGRALLILYESPEVAAGRTADGGDLTFRRMFESNPSPTLVCDRDTLRICAVNQAAVDEYGYSREEFSALSLSDLRPAAAQPRAAYAPRPKQHDQGGLWRQRRRDGSLVDVDITTRVLSLGNGRSELIVSHEATDSGAAAARQFSLSVELFEASTQAISITDADARIIAVNPAFTKITGYEPAEIVGKNSHVLASGRHDRAFYDAMWNEILDNGHWQGELWDRRKNGEAFPVWLTVSAVRNSHGENVQYVAMFSDISERKAAEARIEYLAHYDQLTGLPNRALLHERFALEISQAQRHRRRLGVLFLDLDRFKHVNDTLGHATGDAVLQETARRLRTCLRQGDFVARQGGDEFIVLVNDLDVAHNAAHVSQKILDAMRGPFEIQGHEIAISPSIGIGIYPDDGHDIETLLQNADAAMYQAKSAGRNNYQFFTREMNETASAHLTVESGLRQALENGEFLLQYQPQLEIASGRVTGVEALIRWRHPKLGLIGPARFVAVAEQSRLIVAIGAWVLREACTQAVRWRNASARRLRVSINIPAPQFRQPDFVDRVAEIVSDTGIEPAALELDLTAAALIHDGAAVAAKLRALHDIGVALAIDDFGAGYTSLSELRRLPIDRLKIDRSFVRDIGRDRGAEAIVEALIAVAHSLQVRALAAGVESEPQLAFLRAHGCEEAQGYLFSHPLPVAAVRHLVESGTPERS